MKKPVAYIIACGLSVILWFTVLYSCAGAPGAAAAPGLSRFGTSKVFDPPPLLKFLSKSQHKCFVRKWDQAETNSWFETFAITATEMVNAKEYSELGEMRLVDNLYYVKYMLRFRTLFGCSSASCDQPGTSHCNIALCSNNGILFCLWMNSQIGKRTLNMKVLLIAARLVRADRHANVGKLWIKCGQL